jgi:hypothetical protein
MSGFPPKSAGAADGRGPLSPEEVEAARLESALERIAHASARRAALRGSDGSAQPGADTIEIAAKLDQLIADLRSLLGTIS